MLLRRRGRTSRRRAGREEREADEMVAFGGWMLAFRMRDDQQKVDARARSAVMNLLTYPSHIKTGRHVLVAQLTSYGAKSSTLPIGATTIDTYISKQFAEIYQILREVKAELGLLLRDLFKKADFPREREGI